ncbi:MAG: gliding motility-associated C-terminal domain-containing protein [Chitinophagales bacterium]
MVTGGDTNGTWVDTDGSGANMGDWTAVDFDSVTAGEYTFTYTLTDVSGICGDVSYGVEILVQNCACPNVATKTPVDGLCNDSGTLDLTTLQSTAESGSWQAIESSTGTIVPLTGDTTFDATGLSAGEYTLTFTLDAAPIPNCPDSSVQVLTVQQAVSAGIGSSQPACNNEIASIDLKGFISGFSLGGSWVELSGGIDNGGFDAANGTFTADGQSAGTLQFGYVVTATAPCENDTAFVNIEVVAPSSAEVTTNTTVCDSSISPQGSILNLMGLIVSGDTNGTWADTDGSGANIIDWTAVDFDGVTTGTYTFTYTLTDVSGICGDVSYEVEILVQDCACPNVATIAPTSGLCNDSGTLDLSTLQVTTELGTWAITNTPVGSNPATFTGTTFDATGADAGDYELTFTLDAAPLTSCPDSSVQILTVQAAVSAGTGSSEDVCNDDATPIDLFSKLTNADAGGIWSLTSGTLDIGVFDATNGTFTPLNQSAGTFEFSYTLSASGPCGSDISTVTINVVASPTATLTTDANTCNVSADGSIIDLTSLVTGGDTSGTWTDTDVTGVNMSDWTALDFDGITEGAYIFTYTLNSANAPCTNPSYPVTVLVEDCNCIQPSSPTPLVGLISICDNEINNTSFEVNTEVGTTVNWYDATTGGNLLASGLTFMPTDAGIYYAQAVNNTDACTSEMVEFVLQANSTPIALFDISTATCKNEPITFIFDGIADTDAIYTWDFGGGDIMDGIEPHSYTWTNTGEQNVTLTIEQNGCMDSYTSSITISEVEVGITTPKTIIPAGEVLPLSATGFSSMGDVTYTWSSTGSLPDCLDCPETSVKVNQNSNITVVASDEFGCSDDATIAIGVLYKDEVLMPAAFSPNNDGVNDEFGITPINVSKIETFEIYSRLGNKVFSTNDLNETWDGNYKFVPQDIGLYVYFIRGTDNDGKEFLAKGNVMLIR